MIQGANKIGQMNTSPLGSANIPFSRRQQLKPTIRAILAITDAIGYAMHTGWCAGAGVAIADLGGALDSAVEVHIDEPDEYGRPSFDAIVAKLPMRIDQGYTGDGSGTIVTIDEPPIAAPTMSVLCSAARLLAAASTRDVTPLELADLHSFAVALVSLLAREHVNSHGRRAALPRQ